MGELGIAPDAELTARLHGETLKYAAEHRREGESIEDVLTVMRASLFLDSPVFLYQAIAESGRKCFWGHNEHLVTDIPFDELMAALAFEGMSASKYASTGYSERRVLISQSFDETSRGVHKVSDRDAERLCLEAEIFITDKEGITELKGIGQRMAERIFQKGVMTDLLQPGGLMRMPGPFFEIIHRTAERGNYFFLVTGACWNREDYAGFNQFLIAYQK